MRFDKTIWGIILVYLFALAALYFIVTCLPGCATSKVEKPFKYVQTINIKVENESNILRYDIEHSSDQKNWTVIFPIMPLGGNRLYTVDVDYLPGNWRIHVVELGGGKYSDIVFVK